LSPLPPFDTLESRVLLSGTSLTGVYTQPALNIPLSFGLGPATLVPVVIGSGASAVPAPPVARPTYRIASTMAVPSLGSSASQTATGGPVVTVVKTVTHADGYATGMLFLSNPTSGDLGEASVTPVIVLAQEVGADPSGQPTPPASGFPAAGVTGPPIGTNSASAPVGPPSKLPQSTNASYVATGVPDVKHAQVQGMFAGYHGSMTLQIPVGPMTQEVGVSVRPGSGAGADGAPVLAELTLVDRDGDTIAQLSPISNAQSANPSDAVTVSLSGAPVGGSLIVQLTAPTGGGVSTPTAATVTPPSSGLTVPFVIDVQRLETVAAVGSVGIGSSAGAGRAGIGTLSWTANGQDEKKIASTTTTTDAPFEGPESATVISQESPIPPGDELATTAAEAPPDFSGRIATGPLASRSAAPLGPSLATVLLDAAPAVDRHERALSQDIDARDFEGDDGSGSGAARAGRFDSVLARADRRGRSDEFDPEEGTHVAVAGLGALPLMVPAYRNEGRTTDLDALLAALPGSPSEDLPAVVVGGDHAADDLSVDLATAASSHGETRPAPDYLTAACALALGMGLTTGPLIPDLLRLIPCRSSRWSVVPAGAARLFGKARSRRRGHGAPGFDPTLPVP
jgi:hypothetical protein